MSCSFVLVKVDEVCSSRLWSRAVVLARESGIEAIFLAKMEGRDIESNAKVSQRRISNDASFCFYGSGSSKYVLNIDSPCNPVSLTTPCTCMNNFGYRRVKYPRKPSGIGPRWRLTLSGRSW